MHQMHKYAQFELYAKLNWEPVQTLKRKSDVLSCCIFVIQINEI